MKFLVSAEFAGKDLLSLEPWLELANPVWQGAAPLGVFLAASDRARYNDSDFAALMAVLNVPVSSDETLDVFCAAAMAARIELLTDIAAKERAAAAALRKDFMQLQENFLAVEGFLNGALAPKFTLARHWEFSGETVSLMAGQTLTQALPVGSAALVAVDLWMVSGRVELRLNLLDDLPVLALAGTGWQRAQFPAISRNTNVSMEITAIEDCEIGLAAQSPIAEFGDKPVAMRLWKGLSGVHLPAVTITPISHSFVLPADFPKAEILDKGSAKYLENQNILMIHTDYYGAATLVLRGLNLPLDCVAHIQNCGPETLEISLVQIGAGAAKARKYCGSIFLAPEAYMRADVVNDGADAVDFLIEIKGQTSLDCLAIRGFEIG